LSCVVIFISNLKKLNELDYLSLLSTPLQAAVSTWFCFSTFILFYLEHVFFCSPKFCKNSVEVFLQLQRHLFLFEEVIFDSIYVCFQ